MIYKPLTNGKKLNVFDSSLSLKYIDYHVKDNNALTLAHNEKFTKFTKFNGLFSPVFDNIKKLATYSIINNVYIRYFSDFNATENSLYHPISGNVELIPIHKSKYIPNSSIDDVFPKKSFFKNSNIFHVKIISNYKTIKNIQLYINNKLAIEKKVKINSGINTVLIKYRFPHAGVYPIEVLLNSTDNVKFDDHYYTDIVLKNRSPHILIIYQYPNKDISMLSHCLKYDGFSTDAVSKDKVNDIEKYSGFIIYNTSYKIETSKPVLFVGNCKNDNLTPFFKNGMSNEHGLWSKITIRSKIVRGNLNSTNDNGNYFGNYQNEYFLTFTDFYSYLLKSDQFIEKLIYGALTPFEKAFSKYPHVHFNANSFINGRRVGATFSQKIDSVVINKKPLTVLGNTFSFIPEKKDIELTIKSRGIAFTRRYKVFANELEKKYSGFNKKKYLFMKALLKPVTNNKKFSNARKELNYFEQPVFLIIILVLLVLFWVF